MTAGKLAFETVSVENVVDGAAPSSFSPGSGTDLAWIPDDTSRDFLGNEFILWMGWYLDTESDTVKLSDNSEATFMNARTLVLDCPRGATGHSSFKHEGPARLPEAKRAVKSGKLPRKVGLTIVRNSEQFEFALLAESFGIGSAKLPPAPDGVTQARAKLEERIRAIRNLTVLARMQAWLSQSEVRS